MYAILALSLLGILNLFIGFQNNRKLLHYATLAFIAIAFGLNIMDWNHKYQWFSGMLTSDNLSINFSNIILLGGFMIVGISRHFGNDQENTHPAEYYAIMMFAMAGAIMMTNYNNLMMLFIGIEVLSVSMYVLTGTDKRNAQSNEAALKYFLMGAFATGIFLFGVALLYGATGTFNVYSIDTEILTRGPYMGSILYVGILLLLFGLLFKISIAPFHFWTPDVYQGAPSIFTAFMSTVVKTAGFAAIFKILSTAFNNENIFKFCWPYLIILSITTLIISNVTAIYQKSFKRMMAFSSISHAGYMLIPVLSKTADSAASILFYSLTYTIATVVAFGVMIIVSEQTQHINSEEKENYSIFNGLYKRNATLAVCLTIAMLSLAGIPLTGGFWGKFFAFGTAIDRKMIWILVYAVLASAVGLYYYFKPIIHSFLKEADSENNSGKILVPSLYKFTLLGGTIALVILGLFPNIVKNIF